MRVKTARELGVLVRERRHDLRLNQAELARRAGVGRSWLVAVEQGHPRAELGKLLDLLAELGLVIDLSAPSDAQLRLPGADLDELLGDLDERSRRPR